MTTLASEILDFILGLFSDPEKAEAFAEDPQGALDEAGLTGVTPEEVHDLMPVVSDYAPVSWGHGGHHSYKPVEKPDHCDDDHEKPVVVKPCDDDEHKPVVQPDHCDDDHSPYEPVDKPDHDHGHGHGWHPVAGTETTVIAHVQNIQNTVTVTNINVEIDASHSIWVSGDAQAIFGDVGKGAVIVDEGVYIGDDNEGAVTNGDGVAVDGDNDGAIANGGVAVDGDITVKDNNVNVGGTQNVDSIVESGDGSLVGGDQTGSENDHSVVETGPGDQNVGNETTTVTITETTDNSVDNSVTNSGDDSFNDQSDDDGLDFDNVGNNSGNGSFNEVEGDGNAFGEDSTAGSIDVGDIEDNVVVTGDNSAGASDDGEAEIDQSLEADESVVVIVPEDAAAIEPAAAG